MPLLRGRALLGLVAVLLLGACSRNDGVASELGDALDDARAPTRFAFDYRSGGTRVNDCFLPNRAFSGLVDHDAGVLALQQDGMGEPSAYVARGDIYLRATLFAEGVTEAPWLRATGPLDDQRRAAVVRAIGDGFAGYVASGLLPPDGRATALELLDVAEAVRVVERSDGAARYELRLPPEALGIAPGQGNEESEIGDLVVEVTVAGDSVTRIAVDEVDEPAAEHVEADADLWSVEYRPSERRVQLPDVGPVEDLAGIDPALLQAPTIERCEVPL